MMMRFIEPDVVREGLRSARDHTIMFRHHDTAGEWRWYRIVISLGEDDDHVAVCLIDITDAYRRQYEQQVRLDESNYILRTMNENIIDMFAQLIEFRDSATSNHLRLIKGFTYMLAEQVMNDWPEYGLTPEDVRLIAAASPMHDVGKIAIPDSILMKPGMLTDEEFNIVKTHARKGYDILVRMNGYLEPRYLEICEQVALCHHEKWDGNGYPYGISGEDIPIAAQIVSAADVFESLTGRREYKPVYSYIDAYSMIINGQCGAFSEKILASIACIRQRYGDDRKVAEMAERYSTMSVDYADDTMEVSLLRRPEFIRGNIPMVRELTEYMPGGFFIYRADETQRLIFFNDIMVNIFGCSSREEFTMYTGNTFRGMVHPEDYASVNESINRRKVDDEGESIGHVVFRIQHKDGEIHWIDVYSHMVHTDDYGDIYFAFALDITTSYLRSRRSRLANSDAEEQERIQKLLDESSAGDNIFGNLFGGTRILLVDDNELSREITAQMLEGEGAAVVTASNGAEAIVTVQQVERFDMVLMDIVMPVMNGVDATLEISEYYKSVGVYCPVIGITAEGSDSMVNEMLTAGAYECIYQPLDLNLLSSTYINYARFASKRLQEELEGAINRANTDPLTHVKSFSAYVDFMADLNENIANGEAGPFAVVWCDCDSLKMVNDTYGHSTGDQYIKNNCNLICNAFVHSPAFRVGGDEFAILLQGRDLENSGRLTAELHQAVRTARDIPTYEEGKASVSFGIAFYDPETDKSVADVVKRADISMYSIKNKI